MKHWERTGYVSQATRPTKVNYPSSQAKIALKGTSEDQLLELEAIAKSLNLCARAIHDAGRTQVAAGSRTVLGIGPGGYTWPQQDVMHALNTMISFRACGPHKQSDRETASAMNCRDVRVFAYFGNMKRITSANGLLYYLYPHWANHTHYRHAFNAL